MNGVKQAITVAFAVVSIAAHGYHFSTDFSVVDATGAPYCIYVERNMRFLHGHAYIEDGRYAISVNGNQHFLSMPKPRDVRLLSVSSS